jgi:hypothetical protein
MHEMKWTRLGRVSEIRNFDSVQGKSAVYIFVFDGAPFYVGTSASLGRRLQSHARYFCDGRRAFLRERFQRQIKGKPHGWVEALQNAGVKNFFDLIYVPMAAPYTGQIAKEGRGFWEQLEIFYVAVPREQLKVVETSIQKKIREFYSHQLNVSEDRFKIPFTKSTFWGKVERPFSSLELSHDGEIPRNLKSIFEFRANSGRLSNAA